MLSLTFGEQVKILLSRKGMTIKELAEEIEEKTGKKMSRQNMTQRLGRDNFQEQDMRVIAEILGGSFQLNILADYDKAEGLRLADSMQPTEEEIQRLTKKSKKKGKTIFLTAKEELMVEHEKRTPLERDITIGELAGIPSKKSVSSAESEEEYTPQPTAETAEVISPAILEALPETMQEMEPEVQVEEDRAEQDVNTETEEIKREVEIMESDKRKKRNPLASVLKGFGRTTKENSEEEIKSEPEEQVVEMAPEPEPIQQTPMEERHPDMNPYTGVEYETNSVRMHPTRIGYIQVYDRVEMQWTDMTEWAFLGYQEQKKATLGKDYAEPIYLD